MGTALAFTGLMVADFGAFLFRSSLRKALLPFAERKGDMRRGL
jgi:hypothetical protein